MMSSRQASSSAAGPSNTGAGAAPRVPVHLQGAIKKTKKSETTKESTRKTESAATGAAPRVPVHLQGAIKKTKKSETTKESTRKTESAAKPLEKMKPKYDDEDDLPIAELIPLEKMMKLNNGRASIKDVEDVLPVPPTKTMKPKTCRPNVKEDDDVLPVPPTKTMKPKTCRPNVKEDDDVLPEPQEKMMENAPSHDDDTSLPVLQLDQSQEPPYRPARKFVSHAPVYKRLPSGSMVLQKTACFSDSIRVSLLPTIPLQTIEEKQAEARGGKMSLMERLVARAQKEGAWSAALEVGRACTNSGASSTATNSSASSAVGSASRGNGASSTKTKSSSAPPAGAVSKIAKTSLSTCAAPAGSTNARTQPLSAFTRINKPSSKPSLCAASTGADSKIAKPSSKPTLSTCAASAGTRTRNARAPSPLPSSSKIAKATLKPSLATCAASAGADSKTARTSSNPSLPSCAASAGAVSKIAKTSLSTCTAPAGSTNARTQPLPAVTRITKPSSRPSLSTCAASAVGRAARKSGASTTTTTTSASSAVGRAARKSGASTTKTTTSASSAAPRGHMKWNRFLVESMLGPIPVPPVRAVPTRSVTARIAEAALSPAQCLRSRTAIEQGPPIRNVTELRQSTGQRASLSPDYKEIGSRSMVFCCFCYRCSQQRNINMVVQKCGHSMCNGCQEELVKQSVNEELDEISCPKCTKASKIYEILSIFINE